MTSAHTQGQSSETMTVHSYGKDGPEIKSWWVQIFPHLFRPAMGPTQPPIQ